LSNIAKYKQTIEITSSFVSEVQRYNIFLTVTVDNGLSGPVLGYRKLKTTKTGPNPSPDPNLYRKRCPDPNAMIQKIFT